MTDDAKRAGAGRADADATKAAGPLDLSPSPPAEPPAPDTPSPAPPGSGWGAGLLGFIGPCDRPTPVDSGQFRSASFLRTLEGQVVAVVFTHASTFAPPVSEKMQQVIAKANMAATAIRQRFSDATYDADRETWLGLVCMSARLGAVGERADPESALVGFARLEQMLIQAVRKQRTAYIRDRFLSFFLIVVIAIAGYWLLDMVPRPASPAEPVETAFWVGVAQAQFATLGGLALGVLFSALVHNRALSLRHLESFDPDGFSTWERLLYVWVVAAALEILIYFRVIILGVGGVEFGDLVVAPYVGVLIGVITALSTEVIVGLVQRASDSAERRER